jgi:hypothetical protein
MYGMDLKHESHRQQDLEPTLTYKESQVVLGNRHIRLIKPNIHSFTPSLHGGLNASKDVGRWNGAVGWSSRNL